LAKIGPVMVGGSRVLLTALSWVAIEGPFLVWSGPELGPEDCCELQPPGRRLPCRSPPDPWAGLGAGMRGAAGRSAAAPVGFALEERGEVGLDGGLVDLAARVEVLAGVDRGERVGGVGELSSGESFDP
jgi:hypothetical protein